MTSESFMKTTPQQYAEALYQTLSEARPDDQEQVLDNFVKVLTENGHLHLYPQIEVAYMEYDRKQRGEIPASVTTAREGTAEQGMLDRLNDLIGGTLVIKRQVDESLLGGVLIETEDTRIDASVRGQLKKLKESLTE